MAISLNASVWSTYPGVSWKKSGVTCTKSLCTRSAYIFLGLVLVGFWHRSHACFLRQWCTDMFLFCNGFPGWMSSKGLWNDLPKATPTKPEVSVGARTGGHVFWVHHWAMQDPCLPWCWYLDFSAEFTNHNCRPTNLSARFTNMSVGLQAPTLLLGLYIRPTVFQ